MKTTSNLCQLKNYDIYEYIFTKNLNLKYILGAEKLEND